MKTIGILFGGQSTEYDVSLQSASAVIEHLNTDKFHPILIGITRKGEWLLYQGDVEKIAADTWHEDASCLPAMISPSRRNRFTGKKETHEKNAGCVMVFEAGKSNLIPIDSAFPILHGKNGEDGTIQGLLELAGIPIVGCRTLSSAICMDKEMAHTIVEAAGVAVPSSMILHEGYESEIEVFETASAMGYPLFVKPARSGSSFGITKVLDKRGLSKAVKIAFQHDTKVIIEKNVDGFEVGCAVLGNDKVIIGKVDEIELTEGFFDYTEKYTLKSSKIHMPARIDEITAERIKRTAEVIYKALDCKGFARVDMFLTKEKEIIFNEVNTIPGFTAHSRYPNMMKGIGMDFSKIIETLIDLSLEGK